MHQERRTISEAAEILGVTPSWLRFGERLGALPLARRTPGGRRYYTPEDIARLRRLGVGERKRRLAAYLDELERLIARGALAYWMAFADFCSEVASVETDHALDIVLGREAVEGAQTIRDLAERLEVEADEEVVEELRADFERGWRMIEERGA